MHIIVYNFATGRENIMNLTTVNEFNIEGHQLNERTQETSAIFAALEGPNGKTPDLNALEAEFQPIIKTEDASLTLNVEGPETYGVALKEVTDTSLTSTWQNSLKNAKFN